MMIEPSYPPYAIFPLYIFHCLQTTWEGREKRRRYFQRIVVHLWSKDIMGRVFERPSSGDVLDRSIDGLKVGGSPEIWYRCELLILRKRTASTWQNSKEWALYERLRGCPVRACLVDWKIRPLNVTRIGPAEGMKVYLAETLRPPLDGKWSWGNDSVEKPPKYRLIGKIT